jgi:spore germination protein GerM
MCSACAVDDEQRARVADDESVPFGLLQPDAPALLPPGGAAATEPASLCFVGDDKLVVVPVALDSPVQPRHLVAALAEPPDNDASLRTAVGEPSVVRTVRIVAGIARVDLLPAVSNIGSDEQLLAIAQLVCTLTGRPGVGQVSFTLEGTPVDVPRGDGSLTDGPVSRDDYAELLS